MTALDLVQEAEALFPGKKEMAAAAALAALDSEDPTARGARPRAHRVLALLAWSRRDLSEARRRFGLAADLLGGNEGTSRAMLAAAIDDVALADYYLGRHESALTLRRTAVKLAEEQVDADPALLRRLNRRLAQSLQQAGDLEEAERRYLACRPPSGDGPEDHIGWLNAMALLSEQRTNVVDAARYYAELGEFLGATVDAEGAVAALGNAALFALEVGRNGQVAAMLRMMRARLRTDDKLASRLAQYDVRRMILQSRGRHAAAIEVARQAESLARLHAPDHPSLASRLAMRAASLREIGAAEAASVLLEAHAPKDQAVTADHSTLLIELAVSRRLEGRHAEARHALTLALCAELGLPDHDVKFRVLGALAELAADGGRRQAAALLGKMSLEHVRETALSVLGGELSKWLQGRMQVYDNVLTQLSMAGRLPEAQRLQLRRSQEVSWELGSRSTAVDAPEDLPFRPGEAILRGTFADLQATARGRGRQDLMRELVTWLEKVWAEGFDGAGIATVRPVTVTVGPPLVTYVPNGDGFTGVLERDGTRREFSVGLPADALARALRALRTGLEDRSTHWQSSSEALHAAMIAPMVDALKGASRIDVAVSGIISFVPFAILAAQGTFLIETWDVAMRTGPRIRQPRSGLASTFWRAAAFGSSGTLDRPLSAAAVEVEDLSRRTGGELFLDGDFTAAALRDALARGVQLLHLAGHFRYEPARPHRSALLMGDGSELTLAALAGRDYDFSSVELLVLAACDTAVSDALDMGLEGLAGLAQAKGARNVLATLWRVADGAAANLMRIFYDHLLVDSERDPVSALGMAQRKMLRQNRGAGTSASRGGIGSHPPAAGRWHPADWGGFVAYIASDLQG